MKDPPTFSRDRAELAHAFADLSAVERWAGRAGADGRPTAYIAREVLDGPQFSVATETDDGMHRVVAISGGDPAGAADEAVLRSLVRSLLDLVGHERGPARTEVVLTASGPRVLECRLDEFPSR